MAWRRRQRLWQARIARVSFRGPGLSVADMIADALCRRAVTRPPNPGRNLGKKKSPRNDIFHNESRSFRNEIVLSAADARARRFVVH